MNIADGLLIAIISAAAMFFYGWVKYYKVRASIAEEALEKRKLNDLLDQAKKESLDTPLSALVDENNKRYGSDSKDPK